MSANLLRTPADSLVEPICKLFDYSISTGIVPNRWKRTTIVPIPKHNDATEPKYISPISFDSNPSQMSQKIPCTLDNI